jgi:hypothetical protein
MEESASSSSINESLDDDSINKSNENASSSTPTTIVQLATFSDDTNDKAAAATTSITKSIGKKIDQLKIPDFIRNNWDPLNCSDWDLEKPTQNCLHRIKKY